MDFLDTIIKHYLRESHQGLGAAIFGGILLIAAILLTKFAMPLSLLKGLTIPFFLIGLLMGVGGSIDSYMAQKSISENTALYKTDKKAFFDKETVKVEKTHRSWLGIMIQWSVLTLAGAVLLFSARNSYWTGFAIGLIIVSIGGHVEEAISKKFNERYYHQVIDESKKKEVSDVSQPPVTGPIDSLSGKSEEKPAQGSKKKHHSTLGLPLQLKDGPSYNLHLEIPKEDSFKTDTIRTDRKDTIYVKTHIEANKT